MFSVTIYPVYFRFLLCYNVETKGKKIGGIPSLPKKYSPSGQREEDSIYEKIRAIACQDFRFFSLSSAYLYAEIVIIKNNTNSEFTSVFVLFPCGGEKGIRTLAPVS